MDAERFGPSRVLGGSAMRDGGVPPSLCPSVPLSLRPCRPGVSIPPDFVSIPSVGGICDNPRLIFDCVKNKGGLGRFSCRFSG